MAKHALLSASGAHRWLECTPSALLELQFPQSTSEYAEEGTAAHELCELTARYFLGEVSKMDFENRRDELAKGPYYNAEMQECANDYARFVTEKAKAAQESCEDAFTELEVRRFGRARTTASMKSTSAPSSSIARPLTRPRRCATRWYIFTAS